MDITDRDWKSLPPELLYRILQFSAIKQSKAEVCNNTLICKVWSDTAQTVAYSNVEIKTISQFEKFYNVISRSPHLGFKIKTLNLLFEVHQYFKIGEMEVSQHLRSLLATSLPNLEVLNKQNLHTWVPNLNTLLDYNLKKLKRLQHPDGFMGKIEYDKYINCAFTMKDRLENIYIACSNPVSWEEPNKMLDFEYQRLYNNLYQFGNLVDVTISKKTIDGIQALEHIVESCKSLKNINFSLEAPDGQQDITRLNNDSILNCIPRSNIKSLSVSAIYCTKNDKNLPLYVMHKFPRLQNLLFLLKKDDPMPNFHLISQFLDYVLTIDHFYLSGLSTNRGDLMESIGNVWEKSSTSRSENLYLYYSNNCPENIKASLEVTKKAGERIYTTLQHPTHVDFDWGLYMKFIENSGKFIGAMCFIMEVDSNRWNRSVLPDSFFLHTLAKCPNLRKLHLINCALRKNFHLETALENRLSIDELAFQQCRIEHGMLEQLSSFLLWINRLYLSSNRVYISETIPHDENTIHSSQLMITMPYTDINHIILEVDDEDTYIKVFVSTDEKYYYYKVADTGSIKPSNKQDYEAKNEEQHIYISCSINPKIEIGMLELL